MKKYYDILGINQNTNEQEVRKAYKKMALKVHPDSGGSTFLFQQVNEAYNKIIEKLKKKSIKPKQKPKQKQKTQKNTNLAMDIDKYMQTPLFNDDFFKSPFDNRFFKDFELSTPVKKKNTKFYSETIKTFNNNGRIITKKVINDNGKIYEQYLTN